MRIHVSVMKFHVLCCFDQLRTQALAFLHAGLQNNQGIPIANVSEWLAMEVPLLGCL